MTKRTSPFALLVVLSVQPVLAQPSPGRCDGNASQFKVDAGDLADSLIPYTRCLANAKQQYGYNDGPFAVSQCASVRRSIAASLPTSNAARGERLMDELDKGFVWQLWCSTDIGSELPADIKIRADWPQAQRNSNAPNH